MVQCPAALFNYFMCSKALFKYFMCPTNFTALFVLSFPHEIHQSLIGKKSWISSNVWGRNMRFTNRTQEEGCKICWLVARKSLKYYQSVAEKNIEFFSIAQGRRAEGIGNYINLSLGLDETAKFVDWYHEILLKKGNLKQASSKYVFITSCKSALF